MLMKMTYVPPTQPLSLPMDKFSNSQDFFRDLKGERYIHERVLLTVQRTKALNLCVLKALKQESAKLKFNHLSLLEDNE